MSIKNPTSAPPAPADSRPPLLAYRTPSSPAQREEYFSEICACIREDGVATSDAAILAGIEWDLLLQWQEEHPDYTRRLALARTQYQHELLEEIGEATLSDGSPDWAAQAWLLKQRQTAEDEDLARTAEEAAAAAQPQPMGPPLVIMTEDNLRDLQNRRMAALAALDAADQRAAEAQCRRAVPAPGAEPSASSEKASPREPTANPHAFADALYRMQRSASGSGAPPHESWNGERAAHTAPSPPARPEASSPETPGSARAHPSQIVNAKSSILNSVPPARPAPATATEKRRFRQEEKRGRWFSRKARRGHFDPARAHCEEEARPLLVKGWPEQG